MYVLEYLFLLTITITVFTLTFVDGDSRACGMRPSRYRSTGPYLDRICLVSVCRNAVFLLSGFWELYLFHHHTMCHSFSASLTISGFFILNYLTSISRAYYIDNSNTTAIRYIPPLRWTHNSTDPRVDFSKLYNST
jgi:hypothetical protein